MQHDYQILNISVGSTVSEIKRAYRDLAKHYHPDNQDTGSEEAFKVLNSAYARIIESKPPSQRIEKATPKVDLNKYKDRNRIFRVLDSHKGKLNHKIYYPNPEITEDTVFHFMYGMDTFDVFVDQELKLPQMLTIRYIDKELHITILESTY